jgi:ribonuclease HII
MVIVGIDEVGRGCWAGPVVAAAVALKCDIPGLDDSKKLSKRQREKLAAEIKIYAQAIGVGWVDAPTIDRLGISTAVKRAMEQAYQQIKCVHDSVIIDGNINFMPDNPKSQAIIRADGSIPAVSAASIIAKVARDDYMAKLDSAYSSYEFEKHVGYGTALHMERLKQYGVSDLHRKSYKPIKLLIAQQQTGGTIAA